MAETYSTYEAKAKLSEILRKVESGRTVRIARRGKPVAEIRPVPIGQVGLNERLEDLSARGVIVRAADERSVMMPVARRAGALDRFLSERNG